MSRFDLLGADTVGIGNALLSPTGNRGHGSAAVLEYASVTLMGLFIEVPDEAGVATSQV